MIPRLFTPLELSQGAVLALDAAASHHAIRVLRLGPGAAVELFDGMGNAAEATLMSTTSPATVKVQALHAPAATPALVVSLAQCISAADKMDWTIEKAVELGIAAIHPLQSRKAIVKLTEERAARRHEHWQRLILAACAQSGQNRVPMLHPVMKLEEFLHRAAGDRPGGPDRLDMPERSDAPSMLRLVLDPGAAVSLPAVLAAQESTAAADAEAGTTATRTVMLLCGPESGLSEEELHQARAAGFNPASLGPRVLRTETAGLAALAVLQARWGDLR
jgi:16S rRNA (uracil1498-N3)-methyltransferase